MKQRHLVAALLSILTFCFCSYTAADDRVAPGTKLAGRGISLVSPNEYGWLVLNRGEKGASVGVTRGLILAKYGPTRRETYTIQADYLKSAGSQCEKDLPGGIKAPFNATAPERFKIRLQQAELDPLRGPNFASYYVLAEDYGAHGMPENEKYALLEEMGLAACHPNDPGLLVKVGYSYRYYTGHEDREFKKKAKWVLDHVMFTIVGL
jgi:hypothetical protein